MGCSRKIAGKEVSISHLAQMWWAEPQDNIRSPSENPTTTKEKVTQAHELVPQRIAVVSLGCGTAALLNILLRAAV